MKAIVANIFVGGTQIEVLQTEDKRQWVSVSQLVSLELAYSIDSFGNPSDRTLYNYPAIEVSTGFRNKVKCISIPMFGHMIMELARQGNYLALEMAQDLTNGKPIKFSKQ
jgi:hypothetical protein